MKCTRISHNNTIITIKDKTEEEEATEVAEVEEEATEEVVEEEVETTKIDRVDKDQQLNNSTKVAKTRVTKEETEEVNHPFNSQTLMLLLLTKWRVNKEPNLLVTPSSV